MKRVLRTQQARRDILEIARYLERESQSREIALRFLSRISDRCLLYAGQPEMGLQRSDLGQAVRQFTVAKYIVFYRPSSDGIQVLRMLHGSRDTRAL